MDTIKYRCPSTHYNHNQIKHHCEKAAIVKYLDQNPILDEASKERANNGIEGRANQNVLQNAPLFFCVGTIIPHPKYSRDTSGRDTINAPKVGIF